MHWDQKQIVSGIAYSLRRFQLGTDFQSLYTQYTAPPFSTHIRTQSNPPEEIPEWINCSPVPHVVIYTLHTFDR